MQERKVRRWLRLHSEAVWRSASPHEKKPSDVVVQSRVPRPPGTGRESSVAFWCHRPYPPSHLLLPVSVDSVHQRTPSAFGKPRNKETQCNKIDPSSTVVNMHATIQQHGQLSHPTSVARSATEAITHVRQIESTIAFHCVCNARATRAQMSQPTKHKYISINVHCDSRTRCKQCIYIICSCLLFISSCIYINCYLYKTLP